MVHKPEHKVHSFRGLLGDGGQDEINLERQNANVAYRIVKFEIMPNSFTGSDRVHGVSVWREKQTSISTSAYTPDFGDPDVLAIGIVAWDSTQPQLSGETTIFDNVLFSRDIYVTHTEESGGGSCNYYVELEEVPVSASALMQLKLGVARRLNLEQ